MSVGFTAFDGFVIDKPRIQRAGDRWCVSGHVVEHRPGLHPLVRSSRYFKTQAADTFREACRVAKECFGVRQRGGAA